MFVSQRLIIKRTQAIGYEVPNDSDLVTDTIVLRLIALTGGHQRLINLSFCSRLTSSCLNNFYKCSGLQYLNLSYTNIENISSLINLSNLRSLSLAGLHLINYDELRWIITLEILNLSFSNFSKPELLSNFNLLRSLDFGHTPISNINGLQSLARLEELYLDSTRNISENENQGIIHLLSNLNNLKLLQIGNSNLVKSLHSFQNTLSPLTTIVTKPRRSIFLSFLLNTFFCSLHSIQFSQLSIKLLS